MAKPEIVIVDYGMANLRSVQKAFEAVGHAATITADANRIAEATKLVLPGVGAFQDAIAQLRSTDLHTAILAHIDEGLPFLGICLGMQMLFTRSHEDGFFTGLDVLPGEVVGFPHPLLGPEGERLVVPHMGWNSLSFTEPRCPLFHDIPAGAAVYFVHGYYAVPTDDRRISATANYPDPITAAIWRDNVYATQFHPEKSQQIGLKMLRNFAEVC